MIDINKFQEADLILFLVIASSFARGVRVDEECMKCYACEFHGLGESSKFCAKAKGFLTPALEIIAQLNN